MVILELLEKYAKAIVCRLSFTVQTENDELEDVDTY